MLRYRLKLEPDDNGTVLATSPDLPIATFGADEAEAIRQSADAIQVILGSMIDAREAIPLPAFDSERVGPMHTVSLQTEFKVRLSNALIAAGFTRAELQRRLGWQRESVDRLFRLDHNSRLDQIEAAFGALGKDIGVEVRDAA